MTIAEDAAVEMVAEFGEDVTVFPQSSDEPDDSDNPIYFSQTESSEDPYTETVRVYTQPSEETLMEYGFEEDTDALIYDTEDNIQEGDKIRYNSNDFVVRRKATNQIGNGPYLRIYSLIGA